MSASPTHYRKPTARCVTVLTPFLRHLNTGTLAFVMLVALATLTNMRGKEAQTKASVPVKESTAMILIDNFSTFPKTFSVPLGATVISTILAKLPHLVTSTK